MFEIFSRVLSRRLIKDLDRRLKMADININGEFLGGFLVLMSILSLLVGYLLAYNDVGGIFEKIRVRDITISFQDQKFVISKEFIRLFSGTLIYGVLLYIIILLIINGIIDIKEDKIRRDAERILPEFLMNLAAEIRSGNIIDRAILDAAKEEYGMFSQKIRARMKEYYSGIPLDQTLLRLSEDFSSVLIRRTFVIMVEGIKTGARLADIIEKLAIDIREIQNYKDEIATTLTTYRSFILIATVFGMPLLYAISLKLLDVLYGAFSQLKDINISPGVLPVNINIGLPSIDKEAFLYFAILSIFVTSIFTSKILSSSENNKTMFYRNLLVTLSIAYVLLYLFILAINSLFRGLNI